MGRTTIAITVDKSVLADIDRYIREGVYPNRSKAIEVAVRDRFEPSHHSRLAEECAKLDPAEERALANEGYEAR